MFAACKLPTSSTPASASSTYLYVDTQHRAVAGTAILHFNDHLQTVAEAYADWPTIEATITPCLKKNVR